MVYRKLDEAAVDELVSQHPDLQQVRAELDVRRGSWRRIAELSGIPYRTIQKLGSGECRNPTLRTLTRLAAFFESAGGARAAVAAAKRERAA